MADHSIAVPRKYTRQLRKFEVTDKVHADVYNPVINDLLNNDVYLKESLDSTAEAAAGHIGSGSLHVSEEKKKEWDGKAGKDTAAADRNGLMSSDMYKKLDGISAGAQPNQNAVSVIKAGGVSITATSAESSVELAAGDNITLKGDNSTKKITISSSTSTKDPYFEGTMAMEGNISCTGTITASVVKGIVYNDYAERCIRKDQYECIEPGDIVSGFYLSAAKSSVYGDRGVIGVCSDSYGVLIGGDPEDMSPEEHEEDYVAVGMVGRLKVKVTGEVKIHDLIVASGIPGVGIVDGSPPAGTVVGKALEASDDEGIKKVLIMLMVN